MTYKDVVGYEGLYLVSENGDVLSLRTKKFLKQQLSRAGYYTVELNVNGFSKKHLIHRLVAQAFIPNPDNLPMVNHKDENSRNNHWSNLEWCDARYNVTYGTAIQRRLEHTEYKTGEDNAKSKHVYQFDYEGNLIAEYGSGRQAALANNLDRKGVCKCCAGALKQYGGYVWSYSKEFKAEGKKLYNLSDRPVIQYDLQMNVIREYADTKLTKEYGFFPQSVRQCCEGKLKTHSGYIWQYKK